MAAGQAPHQIGQGRAHRQGYIEPAHGPGPARERQDIGDVGRGQGAEGGLAHPHRSPGQQQG